MCHCEQLCHYCGPQPVISFHKGQMSDLDNIKKVLYYAIVEIIFEN